MKRLGMVLLSASMLFCENADEVLALGEDKTTIESMTETEQDRETDAGQISEPAQNDGLEEESEVEQEKKTEPEQESESQPDEENESEERSETGQEQETDSKQGQEGESEETQVTPGDMQPEAEITDSMETIQNEESSVLPANMREALQSVVEEQAVFGLLYLSDQYPVRRLPKQQSDVVAEIASGQTLWVQDAEPDEDGTLWLYVTWYVGEEQLSGYVERAYFACSDERFLAWEKEYWNQGITLETATNYSTTSDYQDVAQFPTSYQTKLKALKEKHPNWIFVKMDTKLDFEVVVTNECKEHRCLVPADSDPSLIEQAYISGWSDASRKAVSYYLDPRNYMTEKSIFAMEQLTYNASYHTQSALQKFLDGTFMKGKVEDSSVPQGNDQDTSDQSYAKAFMVASAENKNATTGLQVSPFHLASRVYQEQGKGTSPLISGTYEGFEGYYNYFNVKASGSTNSEIYKNGLTYAKQQGWNTRYKSIKGGAATIGNGYILKGQDTVYLQKFDLIEPLYTHQYMQNLMAPMSESSSTYKQYVNSGSLDSAFVFKIPVYQNMPDSDGDEETEVADPTYQISVSIPQGYSGTTMYVDGIAYEFTKSGSKLTCQMQDEKATTLIMYRYDSRQIPIGMTVWTLQYQSSTGTYKAVLQSGLKDLLNFQGFSLLIQEKAGIRLKTGIKRETYNKLVSDAGMEGISLQEIGVLTGEDAGKMVTGGSGITKHVCTQTQEVDGYTQFSYCLGSIAKKQYETRMSFRSFAIVENNGIAYTIYGPILTRSASQLAGLTLGGNTFSKDSQEYAILKQINTVW